MSGEKTIGLVMIVKDEASIIRRCLESARPLVDYILIVDTGSTDGTQSVVRDYIREAGIPGQVLEQGWKNFAWNRSEALRALREVRSVDFGLTIDADETFVLAPGFDVAAFKRGISKDVYEIEVHHGGTIYRRPALFSNRRDFAYKAVLHEYLDAPPDSTRALATSDIHVHVTQDGARSKNANKFRDDARLLADALTIERDPFLVSRYTFYLAQSYRDYGELQLSYDTYLKRAEMGFWAEEVYVSLVRAGQLAGSLGLATDLQLAPFLRAYDLIPTRAEALHGAVAACRMAGRYALGYLLAATGIGLPQPESGLFLDSSVYQYRMLDEFQICAYWTANYDQSLKASRQILADGLFPESDRARLVANAEFAMSKITGLVG